MAASNPESPTTNLQLDYLHPSDELLIHNSIPDIIADTTQYIDNLHSEKMKNYNKFFNLVYSKYAGRKYKIETPLNQIIVHTSDKKKTLIHIHKPQYIQISKKLAQYKHEINKMRAQLNTHYFYIKLASGGVTSAEKDDFIKQRNSFIQLLRKYYTILAYRNLKKSMSPTTSQGETVASNVQHGNNILVSVSEPISIPKDISGSIVWTTVMNNKMVMVPKEQIEQKKQHDADKLMKYNEILTLLQNKNIEGLKEKITEYLNDTTEVAYNTTNNIYDDLIITDLPQIITEVD